LLDQGVDAGQLAKTLRDCDQNDEGGNQLLKREAVVRAGERRFEQLMCQLRGGSFSIRLPIIPTVRLSVT
jgi:hypothetical protein